MKIRICIMSFLLTVSTTWAVTITDNFNRADTPETNDTSFVGVHWQQESTSTNAWYIENNALQVSSYQQSLVVTYNDGAQTLNVLDGESFALSLDVAGQISNVWAGVVFNYNNPSNFYTVRFKIGTADYQFLGRRTSGSWKVIKTGQASSTFASNTFYTVSVSSDTAYTYDFAIKEVGAGMNMVSEASQVDPESISTGGYAGTYGTANGQWSSYDNFSLESIAVQGTTVFEGFNRVDTGLTTDPSVIGADWKQTGGSPNEWFINNNYLNGRPSVTPGVLYNDSLETANRNGTNFTLSVDVANAKPSAWAGIAFNYQDDDNAYVLRIKGESTNYQLLRRIGGSYGVIVNHNASAVFTTNTFYTITITSDTAYDFDFILTEAGSSTVLNSVTNGVDSGSNFVGGYAGLVDDSGGYSSKFDNFTLNVAGPVEIGYAAWAAGWGVDIGEETADYDADGLSNIYEYGLGGDPIEPYNQGTTPAWGIVDDGGNSVFNYVYPQRSDPESGLSYYLEISTDLTSGVWTNNGYTVAVTNVTGGELDFVTNVTDTAAGEKFIRLIIE